MNHFLEIRLLPDPEFVSNVLMNALFAKLHRGLVELNSSTIGLSFPDQQKKNSTLGGRLRLHGSSDDLQRLMSQNWLTGIRDHISISEQNPVPINVQYRVVRRVQVKSNPERLRRRLMKRKGITEAEACQTIPDSVAKQVKLPFVVIKSQSTGQEFRLFIDHQPIVTEQTNGEFNCYGLSHTATVPWF